MKRMALICLLILTLASPLSAQSMAYVLNGLAETISVINIETGAVDNHVATVGAIPNQVVYYGGLLYVVNSGSASLQAIDPSSYITVSDIPLEVNSNPWNVAFFGNYAFVTSFTTARVFKIDLLVNVVVDTFDVGQAPAGVMVHNGKLYVTNTAFNPVDYSYGQGTLTVIDPQTGEQLADIDVGKNPQAVAAGPDGVINVICTGDYDSITGMVYFVHSQNYSLVDSLALGGNPYWPVINSSGLGFVSAGGWFGDGHVFSYDAVSRTVLRDENNPIRVGTGAMGLALDSLGMLYSSGQMANSVTKFTDRGETIATFAVGSGPLSVTIMDTRTSTGDDVSLNPEKISLGTPYPNPFNSSVVIPLLGDISDLAGATLDVFDSNGRLVNRLNLVHNRSIYGYIRWSGAGFAGQDVSSGVYFGRLGGTRQVVKMVLLR